MVVAKAGIQKWWDTEKDAEKNQMKSFRKWVHHTYVHMQVST